VALSIKDEELDRKVRQLASLKNTSFTGAIRIAVDNELARAGASDRTARAIAAVHEAQAWFHAGPIDWSRSEDDILGYDENGIPTQPE